MPAPTTAAVRRRLDNGVTFVAYLMLGAMTLSSPFFVAVSGMRTTGCAHDCTFSLVGAGSAVIVFGCLAVTAAAFVGLLLLPRRHHALWWLPCSALAAAVVLVLVGNHLIDVGVGA